MQDRRSKRQKAYGQAAPHGYGGGKGRSGAGPGRAEDTRQQYPPAAEKQGQPARQGEGIRPEEAEPQTRKARVQKQSETTRQTGLEPDKQRHRDKKKA